VVVGEKRVGGYIKTAIRETSREGVKVNSNAEAALTRRSYSRPTIGLGFEIEHASPEHHRGYRSPAGLSYLGRDATSLNDLGIAGEIGIRKIAILHGLSAGHMADVARPDRPFTLVIASCANEQRITGVIYYPKL
jgi:hypothetical protein